MEKQLINIPSLIKDKEANLTDIDKRIASYFTQNEHKKYASKDVAQDLFISESSLSRFAKKLGFNGYREFIFEVKREHDAEKNLDELTEFAIHTYQKMLNNTYKIVNDHQMSKIARLLNEKPRVFVYGIGSSGLVAKEFCFRFIRLGLDIDALTDDNEVAMNISRINENSLILGISISSKTREIIEGLKIAKEKGATVILLTSAQNAQDYDFIDEFVPLAHLRNLTASYTISPQFPALIMTDIIYTHYLNLNRTEKMDALQESFNRIDYKFE